MRVLGIDPALASTGIAVIRDDGVPPYTALVRTTGKRADTIDATKQRIDRIAEFVLDHRVGVALAVIEGPSIGSRGGSPWDRAGLWWRIVHRLLDRHTPVAVCPPRVRAKWATGRGNADKANVAVAMSRLWPGLPETTAHDEWDALALATMGAQHLGIEGPIRAHHAACLASVAWPDIPSGVAA